jgi:hypothetical protein
MSRTIILASALVLISSCAGALELGGKSADGVKRKRDRADDLADASGGDDEGSDEGSNEGSDEGSKKASSSRVKTSDKDPIGIQNAADELAKMEAALDKQEVWEYARMQGLLYDDLYAPSDEMRESKRYKPLLKWMRDLDVRAAQIAGGHAPEIMGDGKRFDDVSEDAVKAAEDALFACEQAAKTPHSGSSNDMKALDKNYAEYEKKLARVNKIDKRATRYATIGGGTYKDLAPKFAGCEATYAALRMEFEDRAVMEDRVGGSYKDCGYSDWTFVALHLGRNKFGPFEIDGVHTDNGRPFPCKKFPRRGKVPAPVLKAAKAELTMRKGEIWTMVGGFEVQRVGLDIKKYATVRIYSKETQINKNDCGEADPSVVCEASYNETARAYNEITHYQKRADLHRKAGRGPRCKDLLEKAHKSAEDWKQKRDSQVESGDWKKGLQYKTRDDGVLSESKIVSAIEKLGSQADERALGGWCEKAGKSEKPEKSPKSKKSKKGESDESDESEE